MKKFLLLVSCLLPLVSFSQEIQYKEYSYSQFFKMIKEEKDSVFKLKDALIKYDEKTDSLHASLFDFLRKDFNNLTSDTYVLEC